MAHLRCEALTATPHRTGLTKSWQTSSNSHHLHAARISANPCLATLRSEKTDNMESLPSLDLHQLQQHAMSRLGLDKGIVDYAKTNMLAQWGVLNQSKAFPI